MTAGTARQNMFINMDWLAGREFWLAILSGVLLWASVSLFVPTDARLDVGVILLLVIAYPLAEELVFRGVVHEWLLRLKAGKGKLLGISAANLITSLAFACTHLFFNDFLWSAMVFVPSLVIGYVYDRYRDLTPCFLVHAFYNLGFFVLWPPATGATPW